MSEQSKQFVEVAMVKRVRKEDQQGPAEVAREPIGGAEARYHYFTDLDDAKLRDKVLFEHHDAVAEAGGPENVEVLISRPFFRG